MDKTGVLLAAVLLTACGCTGDGVSAKKRGLRLAVTTSTQDSCLLDVLVPPFEARHNIRVDVVAVGTGKALKLGQRGDVDAVLVHARDAEDAFMAAGYGSRREDVMFNTFQIVGPPSDPAGIRGLDPAAALAKIAAGKHRFISRGDQSGTHKKETSLWAAAGVRPDWPDYMTNGQGMGKTLIMAGQMRAYTLTDRGTFLGLEGKTELATLVAPPAGPDAGDPKWDVLKNPYGVIVINPARHPGIAAAEAGVFVDYLASPAAQRAIANFTIAGEKLFHPLHPTSE